MVSNVFVLRAHVSEGSVVIAHVLKLIVKAYVTGGDVVKAHAMKVLQ